MKMCELIHIRVVTIGLRIGAKPFLGAMMTETYVGWTEL